jgi:hypothetical protein
MFSFPSKFGGKDVTIPFFLNSDSRHVSTCDVCTTSCIFLSSAPLVLLVSPSRFQTQTPNINTQPCLHRQNHPTLPYILSCIAVAFPSKQIKNNERRSGWNKRLFSTRRKIVQSSRRSGKRLVVVPCRIWSSRWTFSGIDLDGCFDALDF